MRRTAHGLVFAALASTLAAGAGGSGDAPGTTPQSQKTPDSPVTPGSSTAPVPTPADADACRPTAENLEAARSAVVSGRGRKAPSKQKGAKWPPQHLARVVERFALTRSELARLRTNGFVVPARLEADNFTRAYHEIHRSELPVFVSVDSLLHAVYRSHDTLLARLEMEVLAERQTKVIDALHQKLPEAASHYPADVAGDLDLYLSVARSLASGELVSGPRADARAVRALVDATTQARGLEAIQLFGRPRMVDFSQFKPRGHYATYSNGALVPYFRAAMWLSRLELNLVSRSSRSSAPGIVPDPSETPREAVLGLALADLAERAQVLGEVDSLDTAWALLAGVREDVSLRELVKLRRSAGIADLKRPDAFSLLKTAIGKSYPRTARMHYMPQGSTELPAIHTMLGPRATADTSALTRLVHGDVWGRGMVGYGDVTYLLGHDRARQFPELARDLARFPSLAQALARGRSLVAAAPTSSLYGAWLSAIRGLAEKPQKAAPTFMHTQAFADLRTNSTLAAYGQLRHNHVLLAGQAYDEGGCEIPDGYVEPAPAVYAALARYSAVGESAFRALGQSSGADYFATMKRTLEALEAIANDELAGRPLSDEARRYLAMVVEITPPSSDGPGSNDGWYFSLFTGTDDAFASTAFVADYYTSTNASKVVYAGAARPRFGLFVVDRGGSSRVMVGPVAHAFERIEALDTRLDDSAALDLRNVARPWSKSYEIPAARGAKIVVEKGDSQTDDDGTTRYVFDLARTPPGRVTIELLDHHRRVFAKGMGSGSKRVVVSIPAGDTASYPSALRVRLGEWSTFVDLPHGIYALEVARAAP